jgi:hypothetical protein
MLEIIVGDILAVLLIVAALVVIAWATGMLDKLR